MDHLKGSSLFPRPVSVMNQDGRHRFRWRAADCDRRALMTNLMVLMKPVYGRFAPLVHGHLACAGQTEKAKKLMLVDRQGSACLAAARRSSIGTGNQRQRLAPPAKYRPNRNGYTSLAYSGRGWALRPGAVAVRTFGIMPLMGALTLMIRPVTFSCQLDLAHPVASSG